MAYLGDFPVGAIVRVPWNTQDGSETPVAPTDAGFTRIYKNSSASPRTSDLGVTEELDFGDVVGSHIIEIDTADDTDPGFYAAGGEYRVTKVSVVVDNTTVNATLATFSLVRTGGALERLPAALVSGRMGSDIQGVGGDSAVATTFLRALQTEYVGTVTGATTTTTLIDSGLTQAGANFWVGRSIIFVTGAVAKQAKRITGFDDATNELTFDAFTAAPAAADVYLIV